MRIFIFLAISLFHAMGFSQSNPKPNEADFAGLKTIQPKTIPNLEIPGTNPPDLIITHTGFSLLYNEPHEQASWVAYELTKEETTKKFERTDKFIPDPKVSTKTANNADYAGAGYDRGHLAPAADMGWSEITVAESFYYSNMSPQEPSFNRGIWKKTEELVRDWAIENNSLFIITGPVLTTGLKTIGKNEVSVPKYYYKVILDYSQPSVKGIGFIMPNADSKESPAHFAVSIDSIEQFTGIDFFPLLPDDQENLIEKTLCMDCWTWNDNQGTSTPKKKVETAQTGKTAAVQCSKITQSKKRCKRMTKSPNGYCSQHGGN
nr:DNA/RNA non-specific endonuclease [uncultured Fluviicola sp.]